MATTFDKYDDLIDSRDVIARIEELEAERDALQADVDEAQEHVNAYEGDDSEGSQAAAEALGVAQIDLEEWDGAEELAALKALADEASGSPDWTYGETLIRDSYFRDYAEQLADDTGAIDRNASWPVNCIDWDQAARELQYNYTAVDFDGVTYWVRS